MKRVIINRLVVYLTNEAMKKTFDRHKQSMVFKASFLPAKTERVLEARSKLKSADSYQVIVINVWECLIWRVNNSIARWRPKQTAHTSAVINGEVAVGGRRGKGVEVWISNGLQTARTPILAARLIYGVIMPLTYVPLEPITKLVLISTGDQLD